MRHASGDYIAVLNNDCRLDGGDVYDLCVPQTVTSPLVIGERQGTRWTSEEGRQKASLLKFLSVARESMGYDELAGLIRTLLGFGRAAGMEVTVFDPDLDPDGSIARAFTEAIVSSFDLGSS